MKKNIRKLEFILFSVLIGLFLTHIIFNSITPIDLNSNGVEFDENNTDLFKLPKTSGTQINITTPENKTYYEPMSGYYPATYGFENDENGVKPMGWDDYSAGGCEAIVVDEVGGHKKVVKLDDQSNPNNVIS